MSEANAAGHPAGRLLVVDDERDLRLALVAELVRHGYAVTGVDSGPAALEALRGGGFDVLLADLTLASAPCAGGRPALDGLALLRAGLELDPNLVVLALAPAPSAGVMTGQDPAPAALEALKLGAFDTLPKPINVQTLLPTLERALQWRRARLENAQLREAAALYDLSRAIAVELDAGAVAQKTAAAARAQLGAVEVAVLTLAPGDDALVVAAATGLGGPAVVGERVPLTASLAEWLARPGEPLVLAGPVADPRVAPLFPRPETASAIATPLIASGRVVGVLSVGALAPHPGFSPSHVTALSILANAGAAALENAALVSRLRASESRYREVIEHGADGIVTIDQQGNYLEANSVLLRWLGYTREEFLGRNTRDVVAPEDQADMRRDLEALQAGQPLLARRRLRRKDGSWLPVELSGRWLPDGNFQAFARDITERLRGEQALRESEAKFRAVVENSHDGILFTDARATILYRSPSYIQINGFTDEERVGHDGFETVHPDDMAGLRRIWAEVIEHPELVQSAEYRIRHKNGTWRWIETSLQNLLSNPEVHSVVVNSRDITDRKQAEQSLRDSEGRFAALFHSSPVPTTLSSVDGRILDVNLAFERAMGYGREEIVGKRAADLGAWAAPEERDQLMQRLAEHGSLTGVEVAYRRKSGEILPALTSFKALELNGERFILTMALDITERKEAEDQLRFQARLLGAVGQAVIATDPQGQILYWNHMAEKLYGWTSEEALGQSTAILTPGTISRQQATEILNRVRAGETWTGEYTVQRRDGTTFRAWLTDTPFYDRQGALAGIIGLSTDISEDRQRQREVEAIAQLSAALRAALTREQIEGVILDELMMLLEAEAASLVMADPLAGDLVTEQARGRWAPLVGQRRAPGQGITGLVITTGESYLTDDAANDPRTWPREAAAGLGALAAMPLIAHGQTLGALTVGRAASFGEGDLRLLRSVADISANAMQRATLHEQTRLRAEQLAAVNELARALAGTLLLEQIYEQLEAATRHLLPGVSTVVISRYDPELGLLADVYRAERGVPRALDLAQPVDTGLIQAQAEVLQTRRPVIVNPSARPGPERASLLAPLLAKGGITGMLQAHSDSARFGPDDAELLATVANTAAVSIENARLFAETQLRLLRLQALRTIDLAITSSMDAQISLRVLVDQATTHLGVDAVDVLLLNKESHRLELAAGRGFRTTPRSNVRLDQGLAGQVFMERRLLRVSQLPGGPRDTARAAWLASEGFVAYCGMPLLAKGLVRGVLEVFQRAPLTPDAEWIDFLETLAEQAAIAVDNSALFADLQRSNTNLELAYDTTLEGWSRALDLRDKETEGHTQRVTDLSERLARAMGLGEAELVHIRRGALLHDIGKMGIPDSILLKPGPLTEQEWAVMRRHPIYAFELLAPIPYLRPALDIPYSHHEKWDGTGYPRGLAGEQIPLAARVFAVVDVWDALRSDRPYRPAWPEAKVREHLQALAGEHFDARVVPAFMRLLGS